MSEQDAGQPVSPEEAGQSASQEDAGTPSQRAARPSGLLRLRTSSLPLGLALLTGLAIFLGVVNHHYSITQWLAWRYFTVAGLSVLWALSCLAGGYFLLDRLRIRVADAGTEAALAFPLGVFAFQTAIFLLGLVHLLGVVTFVLLPVGFALAGARRLKQAVRLASGIVPPSSLPRLLVVLFGIAGAALVYVQILSPEAFSWDARWYHLPIAQQYALEGAVRRSPEGWWLAAYPHGASLLYTWGFLLPGGLLFDRMELCAHLEFVIFVATIASIPVLVRALVPGLKAQGTWAVMFLFPGIFLYDGNLCAGADHIAALWCIPLVLALIRVWKTWTVQDGLLFGTFMAAGIASKYSAWSMLLAPGLIFLARAAGLALARWFPRLGVQTTSDGGGTVASAGPGSRPPSRPAVLPALLVGGAALLVLSGQFWLRNWIWYGDPFYPILHEHLRVRPWTAEASASYRVFKTFLTPIAPGMEGVKDALTTTLTFSFKPNDWPVFHRDVPVLGSLFTLSMLCLPFVRASRRLWLAYLGGMLAVAVWYLTSHQDRHLQTWMPGMVACTAATLALVWERRSTLLRGLLVTLVGAQIIWGADVPFFPTHNLLHDSPLRVVSNFLASGFLKTPDRFRLYTDEGLVAERLPDDANLLMHESNLHVGFDSRVVNDQWQGRISYAALASPRAIYSELADLKVTHVGWQQNLSGWSSLGHDLAFLGFALPYTLEQAVLGQYTLARFPDRAPSAPFNDRVAMLACGTPYPNGSYRVGALVTPEPGKPWATPEASLSDLAAAVAGAGFLVVDPGCTPQLPPEVSSQFHPPILRGALRLYVRRP